MVPELKEQDNHRVTFSMEPTELTWWCPFGKWPDKDSLSGSRLKVELWKQLICARQRA